MVQEKPCRTCTDFKTWAALQKKTFDSEKNTGGGGGSGGGERGAASTVVQGDRKECPLDKDELGSKTWAFLHTMAAHYPEKPTIQQRSEMKSFFHILANFYPCSSCAEDLREQLQTSPPLTDSQSVLAQWLCSIHNEVNRKLGKPIFDCTLVDQRWRDGWLDGSCD